MITIFILILAGQATCYNDGYIRPKIPNDTYFEYTTDEVITSDEGKSAVSSADSNVFMINDDTFIITSHDNTDVIGTVTDKDNSLEQSLVILNETKTGSLLESPIKNDAAISDILNEIPDPDNTFISTSDTIVTSKLNSSAASQVEIDNTTSSDTHDEIQDQGSTSTTSSDTGTTSKLNSSTATQIENDDITSPISDIHDDIPDQASILRSSSYTEVTAKLNISVTTHVKIDDTTSSDTHDKILDQGSTSTTSNDTGVTSKLNSSATTQVEIDDTTNHISDNPNEIPYQASILRSSSDIDVTSKLKSFPATQVEIFDATSSDTHDKILDQGSTSTITNDTGVTAKLNSTTAPQVTVGDATSAVFDIQDEITDQNWTSVTSDDDREVTKTDSSSIVSDMANEINDLTTIFNTIITDKGNIVGNDTYNGTQVILTRNRLDTNQERNEILTSTPASNTGYKVDDDIRPFHVYWNVPTMQCKSKGIPFRRLFEKYGIIQNSNDSFQGDKVTILYHPGRFPHTEFNLTTGELISVNGALPQESNLNMHLKQFRKDVEEMIPDENFNGIGIIDFEKWRPIFRQQFGSYVQVKELSLKYETLRHMKHITEEEIYDSARQRFEKAARAYMELTLTEARKMRPRATWGYYAYPYCFNMGSDRAENCSETVRGENDMIDWLWAKSSALYPSLYFKKDYTSSEMASLVRGRVAEAMRVKAPGTPILPYIWYQYLNQNEFLQQTHLDVLLDTMNKSGVNGTIIWGSSNDVNTPEKCQDLLKYTSEVLGPAIAKYTKANIHDNAGEDKDSETTTISEQDKRRNDTQKMAPKEFRVFWNMPTNQCKAKGVPFNSLYDKYGIIQNIQDNFQGDKITLLYNSGLFPHLNKSTTGERTYVNGGVPQNGDLQVHLNKFRKDVEAQIPDKNFTGIGVITLSGWRPIFKQQYGDLAPLINISYEIESKRRGSDDERKTEDEIKERASVNFEKAAKMFMQASLLVAKEMRPLARWGFHSYPFCFNMAAVNHMAEDCSDSVMNANDMIDWLWSQSSALYPSLDISRGLTPYQLTGLIRGRVAEAARIKRKDIPVLPYIRIAELVNETNLNIILKTLYKSDALGFIIWGFSGQVDTIEKCNELFKYTTEVLGPAIAKYTKVNTKNVNDEDQTSKRKTISEQTKKATTEIEQIPLKQFKFNITDSVANLKNNKEIINVYDLLNLGSKKTSNSSYANNNNHSNTINNPGSAKNISSALDNNSGEIDKYAVSIATNISLVIKEIPRSTYKMPPKNSSQDNAHKNVCYTLDSNTVQNILSEIKQLRQEMAEMQIRFAYRFDDLTHTILNRYDAVLKSTNFGREKKQNTL